MKGLVTLIIAMVLISSITATVESQSFEPGDIRGNAMGSTGMGIGRGMRIFFNNVADAAFLNRRGSFELVGLAVTADEDGIDLWDNIEPTLKDGLELDLARIEGRMEFLRDAGLFQETGSSNAWITISPLGIIGRSGGMATYGNLHFNLSSQLNGNRLKVEMNRNAGLKTIIAFVRSWDAPVGKLSWGIGIPFRYMARINEKASFKMDPHSDDTENIEYMPTRYSSYTDIGYNVGMDAGVSYVYRNIYVGFSVHDVLSSPIKWKRFHVDDVRDIPLFRQDKSDLDYDDLEHENIKPDYSIGAAARFDRGILGFFKDFVVAGEVHKEKDGDISYNAGAETTFLGFLSLRGGIDRGGNLCYGCGLKVLMIDIGLANYWVAEPGTAEELSGDEDVEYENVKGAYVGLVF